MDKFSSNDGYLLKSKVELFSFTGFSSMIFSLLGFVISFSINDFSNFEFDVLISLGVSSILLNGLKLLLVILFSSLISSFSSSSSGTGVGVIGTFLSSASNNLLRFFTLTNSLISNKSIGLFSLSTRTPLP